MERLNNFIDGQYVAPASAKYLDKISPMTAEKIYDLADSNEVDVVNAVKSAQQAFAGWAKTPVAERSRILYRVAQLIEDNGEALALAETGDVGKPLALAKSLDIARAALNFRHFS